MGAKGATLHEALVRRYPGASFARDTPSSPHTACLPWTWHMYFAPVWWDETCAPLWRYRGQRWDPRSDAWLLHPWRRLVYLQDRQWEGPRGWGGLLGRVWENDLDPPPPAFDNHWSEVARDGARLLPSSVTNVWWGMVREPGQVVETATGPDVLGRGCHHYTPPHTHTTPPLPKQPGPQGALTRCLSALYPGRCGLPLGDSGCGRAGLERAVK